MHNVSTTTTGLPLAKILASTELETILSRLQMMQLTNYFLLQLLILLLTKILIQLMHTQLRIY